MAIPGKPSALVKPTLDTKFHIDDSWWERSGEDRRVYLLSHLLPDQRKRLSQTSEEQIVDYVDPETAEVFPLNELQLAIQIAAQDPNFIASDSQLPLVDSIFRVFLKNKNTPLSPRELSQIINRPALTILKTLSGERIYKGLRPYHP